MREIKQSSAANVMVFMVDSADHVTGKTGLTLSVTLSKDGGAFSSISPTVTERGNGWYNLFLTTANTNVSGSLVVRAMAVGADPGVSLLNVVANVEADTFARIGAPAAASVSADVAAVKLDTGGLRTDYTQGRAANLDNLDSAITSRLSSASYTAPDNAGIMAIQAKTDNLPVDPASEGTVAARPTLAAMEASTVLAKEATLTAMQGDVDFLLACIRNKKEVKKIGSVWYLIIYDALSNEILRKELKDKSGNVITDLAAGALAQEFASSV